MRTIESHIMKQVNQGIGQVWDPGVNCHSHRTVIHIRHLPSNLRTIQCSGVAYYTYPVK